MAQSMAPSEPKTSPTTVKAWTSGWSAPPRAGAAAGTPMAIWRINIVNATLFSQIHDPVGLDLGLLLQEETVDAGYQPQPVLNQFQNVLGPYFGRVKQGSDFSRRLLAFCFENLSRGRGHFPKKITKILLHHLFHAARHFVFWRNGGRGRNNRNWSWRRRQSCFFSFNGRDFLCGRLFKRRFPLNCRNFRNGQNLCWRNQWFDFRGRRLLIGHIGIIARFMMRP